MPPHWPGVKIFRSPAATPCRAPRSTKLRASTPWTSSDQSLAQPPHIQLSPRVPRALPRGCPLPGTPYVVSIRTPSPSYVDCEPERCIQVAIRRPSFGLVFARILGFDSWSVNTTSVAGRVDERQYGIVTLRPPLPRGPADANEKDIFITGGSKVVVGNADVATNTNLLCSGSGSELVLDPGYRIYHFDPY